MTCKAILNNVHIHPTGTITPCCAWPADLAFDQAHILDQWQQGIVPEGCTQCVAKEVSGEHSLREYYNNLYEDNTHLQGVDISVDNVCNLQCLMCSSEYSHACGAREQQFLGVRYNPNNTSRNTRYTQLDWTHVKYIKLFGGEPTYSPGIKQFLTWADTHIDWKNIHVEIVTNGTRTPDAQLDGVLRSAKHTRVVISQDGIEPVNRLIRQGTTPTDWTYWESITDDRYINTAASIYNAPTLKLFEDTVRPGWRIHYEMVSSPAMLDLRNMPEDLKCLYVEHTIPEPVRIWMQQPGVDLFDQFLAVHRAYNTLYNLNLAQANPVLNQYIQQTNAAPADFDSIRKAYV